MRTLYLLRHAQAESGGPEVEDTDRRLTSGGEAEAQVAGRHIASLVPKPTLLLASRARRAARTGEIVAAALGLTPESVKVEEALYLASAESCARELRQAAAVPAVVLIAHNPGLEELAGRLCHRSVVLPPAGLLTIELPIDDWEQVDLDQRGRFVSLWTPGI